MNTRPNLLVAGIFLSALVNGFCQPVITKQPTNQTASLFAAATFPVTANGDAPLSYQWRFNDGDLIGMTNTFLTVTNVQRTNAGNYNVVVTNLSGSVTSQAATLTITPFNSIFCFGYSWTDTHNCSSVFTSPDHYKGRASNGPLWPEFLSTNLGLVYVESNNYAHCGANSPEILDQVITFQIPAKPQLSIYFFWVGLDVDLTNKPSWNQSFQTDILNNSNAVNRLYAKGARQIVIQLHHDDMKAPSWAGANSVLRSDVADYETQLNAAFLGLIDTYSVTKPDLRIVSVDTFSKLDGVLANPAQYGFTKTTIDALDDMLLVDKSFTGPGADYVYWDPGHGTSKLHKLIAAWNLEALTNSILEKLEATIANGSPNLQMNHLLIGRDYTLQKSPDLRSWSDVQTFTAAAGTNQWSDAAGDSGRSYFRLKWER